MADASDAPKPVDASEAEKPPVADALVALEAATDEPAAAADGDVDMDKAAALEAVAEAPTATGDAAGAGVDADGDVDAVGGGEEAVQAPQTPPPSAAVTLKKPQGAYFIFTAEKRAEVAAKLKAQGDGAAGVTSVAKALGAMWKAMTDKEKQVYKDKQADAKAAYDAEVARLRACGVHVVDTAKKPTAAASTAASDPTTTVFPIARLKKLFKADEDVKLVSKDATVLIGKATEMFVAYITALAAERCTSDRRKQVRDVDVAGVVHADDGLDFLRADFTKPSPLAKKKRVAAPKKKAEPVPPSRTLHAFFGGGK